MAMEIRVLASSSTANATYITDGKTPLLLDCGLSMKRLREAMNFKVSEVEAVLCTHSHKDHCKGVPELAKAGIRCYLNQQTIDSLQANNNHQMRGIAPMQRFNVGTWKILAFDTVHDVDNLGYLLQSTATREKLLYITDTAYCKYRFRGVTHVLIECNYSLEILREKVKAGIVNLEVKKRIMQSHFAMENVKEFFRANDTSRLREVWLTHLSDDNSDEEMFRREIAGVVGVPVYVAGK